MGNSAKIKDVAFIADVSKATVSYVVNGKAEKMKISPATQARVLAAVRQTGYTPNRQARDMALGRRSVERGAPSAEREEGVSMERGVPSAEEPSTSSGQATLTTAIASAGYRLVAVEKAEEVLLVISGIRGKLVGLVYSEEQVSSGERGAPSAEGKESGERGAPSAESGVRPQPEGNVGGALRGSPELGRRAAIGSTRCLDGTIAATERASHIEKAPTPEPVTAPKVEADLVVPEPTRVHEGTPVSLENQTPIFEPDPAPSAVSLPKPSAPVSNEAVEEANLQTESNVGGALRGSPELVEVVPPPTTLRVAMRAGSGAVSVESNQDSSLLEGEPRVSRVDEEREGKTADYRPQTADLREVREPVSEQDPVIPEAPVPINEPSPSVPESVTEQQTPSQAPLDGEVVPNAFVPETGSGGSTSSPQAEPRPPSDSSLLEGESRFGGMSRVDEERDVGLQSDVSPAPSSSTTEQLGPSTSSGQANLTTELSAPTPLVEPIPEPPPVVQEPQPVPTPDPMPEPPASELKSEVCSLQSDVSPSPPSSTTKQPDNLTTELSEPQAPVQEPVDADVPALSIVEGSAASATREAPPETNTADMSAGVPKAEVPKAETSASTSETMPEQPPIPVPPPAPVVLQSPPLVAPVVEVLPDTIVPETGSSRQSGIRPPEESDVSPSLPTSTTVSPGEIREPGESNVPSPELKVSTPEPSASDLKSEVSFAPAVSSPAPVPTPAPIVVPQAPPPCVMVETPPPAIESATPAPVLPPEPAPFAAPPSETASTLMQDGLLSATSSPQAEVHPAEEGVNSPLMSDEMNENQ